MSHFIEDLCKRIEDCARSGKALRPHGGETKNFLGGPLQGEPVDMRPWQGIIEYEPTELVMTVKAGTLLSEVEAALAANNQELAFEPPRFGSASTIGGAVVSGLAGPARLARGGVKDYVLGCTLIDGQGQLLHFGGVVMKNVAGYDVSRVLPGSMGTLGIAVDLSIKVLPTMPSTLTLTFDMDSATTIDKLNHWLSGPLPIQASAWYQGRLTIRLAGASAAVHSAHQKLGGTPLSAEEAQAFWQSIRDQEHAFFKSSGPLLRIAVPPTTPDLGIEGTVFMEWGCGLRWLRPAPHASIDTVRATIKKRGGHVTIYRGTEPEHRTNAYHMPDSVMLKLQQRLKAQFDPAAVLSPLRLSPLL